MKISNGQGAGARGGHRLALLALAAFLPMAACAPDITFVDPSARMVFDTDTGRIPMPNIAAQDQTTGYLNFATLGYNVPKTAGACVSDATGVGLSIATCEFLQYYETLNGFPTLSSVTAPTSHPLDVATLTLATGVGSDNVAVLYINGMDIRLDLDVVVGYDATGMNLTIDKPEGWEVGYTYIVSVRGYEDGITTDEGEEVISSAIYHLLRREESLLTCKLDEPDPTTTEIPIAQALLAATPMDADGLAIYKDCQYWPLIAQMVGEEAPDEEVLGLLISLESLRQGFILGTTGMRMLGPWALIESNAGITKAETAILWAFPIHSQPVVELMPGAIEPIVVDASTVALNVKGDLDASTLEPFVLWNGATATTFWLNTSVLAADPDNPDLVNGIIGHDASFIGGQLVLTAHQPLVDGDTYTIFLVAEHPDSPNAHPGIKSPDGENLVPSPVTVFLRNRGNLIDGDGNPLISADAATAAQLEAGRVRLLALFASEDFVTLTGNLIRENLAYLYAFTLNLP